MTGLSEKFKHIPTTEVQTGVAPELSTDIQIEAMDLLKDIHQVADLFADVFAVDPWNEYTKCVGCSSFSGIDTHPGDTCPHCRNSTLQLAYPHDETVDLIKEAGSRPNATMLIARQDEDIIGFAWGYTYSSMEELIERNSENSQQGNDQMVAVLNANNIKPPIFYFAEIGIGSNARGRGLSHLLVEGLIERASELDQPLLMTTNWKTRMVPVAKKFGMKLILGPESYYDKTTNLMIKSGIVAHSIDVDRPDRTLFLLDKKLSTQLYIYIISSYDLGHSKLYGYTL